MKIATWNVNALAVRLPQLLDWLGTYQPDVLCLQETKLTDDKFPHAAIAAAGYQVITAMVDGVRIVGVYVPNGQSVESEKFPYKLAWLTALRDWLKAELAAHPQLALLGDYNIAPEDRDVYDPVTWAGEVLCTPEERAHFKGLLALGLHDAFRLFEQPPKQYSWWDYRMLGFQKNKGLRIDHILVSDALKPRVQSVVIDRPTRKNDRPSDHAPVIAELKFD